MVNLIRPFWQFPPVIMLLLFTPSLMGDEQPPAEVPARTFTAIEVYPAELTLSSIRDSRRVLVTGVTNDGQRIDLSSKATVTTQSPVCQTDEAGFVAPLMAGDGTIIVEAEGLRAEIPVHVLSADVVPVDFIREVNPILSKVGCNQGTCHGSQAGKNGFKLSLRGYDSVYDYRASLDITGVPPASADVLAFVADPADSMTKRAAKIDQLLSSPMYVEHWTLKWSDLLLNRRKAVTERGVWSFRNWIRQSVASNKPYNEFAKELLTSGGSAFENPAANYFRIAREPKLVMENMTQVFLGTRFNCNQCHDHPFERWTQRQY